MLRRLTRLTVAVLCMVLIGSVLAGSAEARSRRSHGGHRTHAVHRLHAVFGVSRADQDWYHAKLKIKWVPVVGASYEMRWSYTPAKLALSKLVRTGTSGGTYSGVLDRGKTWYFQVRAVVGGSVGPWSSARGIRFVNTWPQTPTLSGSAVPGGMRFTWPYSPYASRYRVRWSAAWYGQWPGSPGYVDRSADGWVNQYARSSTFAVPTKPAPGDNFLAVDYANPVFAQVEANDAYRPGASQRSKWVATFPPPATPAPGYPVRMGTYNVMLYPTGDRAVEVAENISTHDVTVAALQEASNETANAVLSAMGPLWRAAPSGANAGEQILYRNDLFSVTRSGTFPVPDPKNPSRQAWMPWTQLALRDNIQGAGQQFMVASLHFSEDASKSSLEKNRDTGLAAQAAMRGINAANGSNMPVIVAGDLRYGREPYGDPTGYTPAQPTFVRGGYYDAMAALQRTGSQYSVVNSVSGTPTASQTPHPSGLGPRSDHILVKGFRGSFNYVNVFNWSSGGHVPSDHNLVYADLAIPE